VGSSISRPKKIKGGGERINALGHTREKDSGGPVPGNFLYGTGMGGRTYGGPRETLIRAGVFSWGGIL